MNSTEPPKTLRGWWIAPALAVVITGLLGFSGLNKGVPTRKIFHDIFVWMPKNGWHLCTAHPILAVFTALVIIAFFMVGIRRRSPYLVQLVFIGLSVGWLVLIAYSWWLALVLVGGP